MHRRDCRIQADLLNGRRGLYAGLSKDALKAAVREPTRFFTNWFGNSEAGARDAWNSGRRADPRLNREALEVYLELARRALQVIPNTPEGQRRLEAVQGTRIRIILREIELREREGKW
jgi:hypothetical protein